MFSEVGLQISSSPDVTCVAVKPSPQRTDISEGDLDALDANILEKLDEWLLMALHDHPLRVQGQVVDSEPL